MGKREGIVAGLDLGSTKTCAVIAEPLGDKRTLGARILGVGTARSGGVLRGVVRDIEETTQSIVSALEDAERMSGVKVPSVYCSIAGEHVQTRTSNGVVAVSGSEITRSDVERAHEVACAISLGADRELLDSIPQEYKVDGQSDINDPEGMTGLRLEVEMYLVTVQATAAQNLRRAVERAGYRVADLVLDPLAGSLSTLSFEERDLGCAMVDIGGASTDFTVFKEGKIRHMGTAGFAGTIVTKDIVQGLGVTQGDAEDLKRFWGVAYETLVDPEEMIDLPGTQGQGQRRAKRGLLAHIIQQRLDEIFHMVRDKLEGAGYPPSSLPAGVILTGGVAQTPGIIELAREVFAMPVRVGTPQQGVSGLMDSVGAPQYAVPVGLALCAARARSAGATESGPGVDKLLGPVKRWLQDFF